MFPAALGARGEGPRKGHWSQCRARCLAGRREEQHSQHVTRRVLGETTASSSRCGECCCVKRHSYLLSTETSKLKGKQNSRNKNVTCHKGRYVTYSHGAAYPHICNIYVHIGFTFLGNRRRKSSRKDTNWYCKALFLKFKYVLSTFYDSKDERDTYQDFIVCDPHFQVFHFIFIYKQVLKAKVEKVLF